ncbi:MAG TPA: acetyl-CoA carboxylase biotin carboxyl carrier protein [Thermoanaerobaculia bacterium]|nr:acetyl-CoA carboxylase biotin carboxyl carrier protein [Thermoanaerobaculia bacterium]
MLTFDQIKELASLVSERGLEVLEIERSGFRLRIAGPARPSAVGTPVPAAPLAPVAAPAESPRSSPATAGALASGKQEEEDDDRHSGAHLLTSPIVGTFYVCPSPDADPFVRVGDRVEKGQIVCIVEAMKLMNEIEADVDGVVVEVIPQNAQPVEYGEPLFAIRPD